MKHYVCNGGCGGESETPGVCQALACPKQGKDLIECECVDKMHKNAMNTCENCGKVAPEGAKTCASGECDVELFKPELN